MGVVWCLIILYDYKSILDYFSLALLSLSYIQAVFVMSLASIAIEQWTDTELNQLKIVYMAFQLSDYAGVSKYYTDELRQKVARLGNPYSPPSLDVKDREEPKPDAVMKGRENRPPGGRMHPKTR